MDDANGVRQHLLDGQEDQQVRRQDLFPLSKKDVRVLLVPHGDQDQHPNPAIQNQQHAALFPLSREVLIGAAQPVATVAIVTTCTALVLAGQGLDSSLTNPHVSAVINALLFVYLPVGLFGLLLAVAVKTRPALVGISSGYMLAHLLIPTVIGGVVNVVKSHEPVWAVVLVSTGILILTVLAWAYLCSYPQCRRRRVQPAAV
ncbi:uncharacterized protein [Miscanthus floridulus]|uniref:uncharacterized protein n=1 Tax=Miscanthus floridulus TaxID=154761 RepID=UPI003458AEB8